MKQLTLLGLCLLIVVSLKSQNVGIGTQTPDASAQLDISSNSKGLLIPRMTTTERDNISNPAEGLMVYVTTNKKFYAYTGSSWLAINFSAQQLTDTDNDTKILVEESPDEDIIRFRMAGQEKWVMQGNRLEPGGAENSVYIGNGAGQSNLFMNRFNVAVGDSVLSSNTTGAFNTAVGHSTLKNNTTGQLNTAYGNSALYLNTIGHSNVAIGDDALYNNTEGDFNTVIGRSALKNNTTGNSNSALGSSALISNTTGSENTANGSLALFLNSTGHSNTAFGRRALTSNGTGSFNTA